MFQDLYGGPEGRLWELVAGEMLHCGGLRHTTEMATETGISEGKKILDICSGFGTTLRLLAKKFKVHGFGIDGSPYMVAQANERTRREGLSSDILYQQGDVHQLPWANDAFDFVWSEDAWCYLNTKADVIKEAVRVLKPGGVMGFSDWVTGPVGMTREEAARVHGFLQMPYTESVEGYSAILEKNGMRIRSAKDLCDQFVESMSLYIRMISEQLTYDALKILGDDPQRLDYVLAEWSYLIEMGRKGKFGQGRIVAIKA
jgi:ubiquinone/menaquinone biosynthesis C-methylase UbiE